MDASPPSLARDFFFFLRFFVLSAGSAGTMAASTAGVAPAVALRHMPRLLHKLPQVSLGVALQVDEVEQRLRRHADAIDAIAVPLVSSGGDPKITTQSAAAHDGACSGEREIRAGAIASRKSLDGLTPMSFKPITRRSGITGR
jgi:hypothetical protein